MVSIKQKFNQRCKKLLNDSPSFINDYYYFYHHDVSNFTQPIYKRISEFNKFLTYYCSYLDNKELSDLQISDLEHIDITVITDYIFEGPIKDYKSSSKIYIINVLSSFWKYFTTDSYSLELGRPIFYRNAINEWKYVYRDDFTALKNNKKLIPRDKKLYKKDELKEMLHYFDHLHVLNLTTEKKIDNWKSHKDRDLAILAILIGTGISIEEIQLINLEDINLKKKTISIIRETRIEIPIVDFTFLYIKPFVEARRKMHQKDVLGIPLFSNKSNQRFSRSFFPAIIRNLESTYAQPISPSILKHSHNFLYVDSDIDPIELKKITGFRSNAALLSYFDDFN